MAFAGRPVRVLCAAAAGVALAGLVSGPALAHVEVEADKAQAGAQNVTLTFTGEAESTSAGIKSERVVLPAGVAPGDVRLVKAPKGWKFTTTSDGFTVGGTALGVGQDAKWSVKIAQLPTDATTLSFKTLETYADGEVARWIDLPKEGEEEPENPAPTIKLKPAAAPATSSPAATTSSPPAVATPTDETSQLATDTSSGTSGAAVWIAIAIAVVLAAAGLLFWRRRSRPSS
jgi:hypothetical protein